MPFRHILAATLLAIGLVGVAHAESCVIAPAVVYKNGRVDPNPHDGDTVKVVCPSHKAVLKVRLLDIDAPELAANFGPANSWPDQPFGQAAATAAHNLCPENTPAKVSFVKFDRRTNRWLGRVRCNDIDWSEYMAGHGYAWSFMTTKGSKAPALMADAKAKGLGLWALPNPIMPSDWRRGAR